MCVFLLIRSWTQIKLWESDRFGRHSWKSRRAKLCLRRGDADAESHVLSVFSGECGGIRRDSSYGGSSLIRRWVFGVGFRGVCFFYVFSFVSNRGYFQIDAVGFIIYSCSFHRNVGKKTSSPCHSRNPVTCTIMFWRRRQCTEWIVKYLVHVA